MHAVCWVREAQTPQPCAEARWKLNHQGYEAHSVLRKGGSDPLALCRDEVAMQPSSMSGESIGKVERALTLAGLLWPQARQAGCMLTAPSH